MSWPARERRQLRVVRHLELAPLRVASAGHEDGHVIASPERGAVTFYRVNPEQRTARVALHADMRDGLVMADGECYVLWQMNEARSDR